LNPDQNEPFYYKALSFAFLGKFKKAVKTIDNAIKLNPDNVRYWNDKGAFLSQLNFTVKAHNAFDRAISIESNNYSWSNKGILYCRYGKLNEALDCFEKAIDLDENDVTSLVVSAAIYSELKNCQKADEYFDRAERIDCDNVIYLAERGKHLFNQNEFQKSIEYFDRYLKIDNEAAFVWMYKSMALSELGRDEESEMCFKKAYKLDPNSIDVFDEVVVIEE
jgi:tetratricopeptide (TPR) repeat protein